MPKEDVKTSASEAALRKFHGNFEKSFGEGTLHHAPAIVPYEVISTGSLLLDIATGVGGLVKGRLHEWWGVDAIGKTTAAILCAAEAQKRDPDKMVCFIDVERTFDPKWAAVLGLDLDRLFTYTPTTAEDVADALRKLIMEGPFSFVCLDSIGAMIPKREMEKMADEAVVADQAKIITRMVKKNAVAAADFGVCVLFINQVRANVSGYGAATTTGGGFALKHSTTMKMQFKRTGTSPYVVKEGGKDITVGHEMAVLVERNKVAPSKRTAITSMFFVESEKYGPIGVDRADEAARIAIDTGQVQRAGAWYTHLASEEKFNGLEPLVDHLRGHPEVVLDIRETALSRQAGQVIEDDISKGEFPSEPVED